MLINEIREKGIGAEPDYLHIAKDVEIRVRNIPVIEATNVAAYLHQLRQTDARHKHVHDLYPVTTPPFPRMFIQSNAHTRFPNAGGLSIGLYVQAIKSSDSHSDELTDIIEKMNPDNTDYEFAVIVTVIMGLRGGIPVVTGKVIYLVSADGKALPKTIAVEFTHYSGKQAEECREFIRGELTVALMTFSLMHCKNVKRIENTIDKKIQQARHRRNKPPLSKYYTLEIEPMKEVLRKEGNIAENGLKKALHICRGHFSTYTEEKPLFGRVSGTFWIPSHTRGSLDAGQVKKDYAIKLPTPPPR